MNRLSCFSMMVTLSLLSLLSRTGYSAHEAPSISEGIQAFQKHRWLDAMAYFLDVLRKDPQNVEAHKYIPLTIRELEAQNHVVVRELRLNMMSDSTRRLENARMDVKPLESAVAQMTHSEERTHEERWTRWLEQAGVERQLGHLLAANDLLLRILSEKRDHSEARQELSLVQSDMRKTLDQGSDLLVQERYAMEGFYAYDQADFPAAASAWGKARTILKQTYAPPQSAEALAALHFTEYEKLADADVAQKTRDLKTQRLFGRGIEFYDKGRYAQALEIFREVAFTKPDYPQLAFYLVHAESGVERERTRLLSEARRQEIAATLEKGVGLMEKEKYSEAGDAFRKVLALDPSNPPARSYLTVVQAEIQKRHDPKTAQTHYEAGLIAYASGKLEEAVREWRIATRMDPQNEKAVHALTKVQKELAFSKELP